MHKNPKKNIRKVQKKSWLQSQSKKPKEKYVLIDINISDQTILPFKSLNLWLILQLKHFTAFLQTTWYSIIHKWNCRKKALDFFFFFLCTKRTKSWVYVVLDQLSGLKSIFEEFCVIEFSRFMLINKNL